MPLAQTNASEPKLERMQREAWNECCITKISRWGAREGGEATAIYTRQVLSEPLTRRGPSAATWLSMLRLRNFTSASPVTPASPDHYLSKLRRDSIGTDFQSVRKLSNYVCAKPLESRLSAFRKTYKKSGYICNFPYIRSWIAQPQRLKILPKVHRLGRQPNIL